MDIETVEKILSVGLKDVQFDVPFPELGDINGAHGQLVRMMKERMWIKPETIDEQWITPKEKVEVLQLYRRLMTFKTTRTEAIELVDRLRDRAKRKGIAGVLSKFADKTKAGHVDDHFDGLIDDLLRVHGSGKSSENKIIPVGRLLDIHKQLRTPLIDGLLRCGETLNLISDSKLGKSWLSLDLALSIAQGKPWMGFDCSPGRVLYIDNELHPESIVHRVRRLLKAKEVNLSEVAGQIDFMPLRGRLIDMNGLGTELEMVKPGAYALIICDAFYRLIPEGLSEIDNAAMMRLFNLVDQYANRLGAAFALIHHTSKGEQGQKKVTDVGSGAGSISRAADTHCILRRHEEPGCVVLQAAVRSFAPVDPKCLRWEHPCWRIDGSLDPAKIAGAVRGAFKTSTTEPKMTPLLFARKFVNNPAPKKTILAVATDEGGLSLRSAENLLLRAEQQGCLKRTGNTKSTIYELTDDDRIV